MRSTLATLFRFALSTLGSLCFALLPLLLSRFTALLGTLAHLGKQLEPEIILVILVILYDPAQKVVDLLE
jgi:hypothetical protein